MAPQLAADLSKAFSDTAPVPTPRRFLDEYCNTEQLAAELGVDARTIERWRADKSGPPATWLGRKLLYRRNAVRKWRLEREEAAG